MSLISGDISQSSKRKLQLFFDGMPELTDHSVMYRLEGEEGISQPFCYQVSFLSTKLALDPMDLIGLGVKFGVAYPFDDSDAIDHIAFRHGIIRNVAIGPTSARTHFATRVRMYTLEVVPWFDFLKTSQHRRIFEHKNVCEILQEILDDYPYLPTDHEIYLPSDHYKRYEVRCQFDESDFEFITRILASEGIFYYFKHEDVGSRFRHKMVVADRANQYMPIEYPKHIGFHGESQAGSQGMGIHRWEYDYQFQAQTFVERDYDFSRASPDEQAIHSQTAIKPDFAPKPFSDSEDAQGTPNPDFPMFSVHEYGRHQVRDQEPVGNRLYPRSTQGEEGLSDRRMAELESRCVKMKGVGTVSTFMAGGKFAFHHGLADFSPEDSLASGEPRYVVTWLETDAQLEDGHGGDIGARYLNKFRCQDAQVTRFWPDSSVRPKVIGPQTAIVVDSDGNLDSKRSEPVIDQFGRVRVRFHWDATSSASCWVRVSQSWAGPQHGAMMFPLVGHEVLVEFIDGNPDRPVIIGRVYNAHNQHPLMLNDSERDWSGHQMMIRDPVGNYMRWQGMPDAPQMAFHTVAGSASGGETSDDSSNENVGYTDDTRGSSEAFVYMGHVPNNATILVADPNSNANVGKNISAPNGIYGISYGGASLYVVDDLNVYVQKSAKMDVEGSTFIRTAQQKAEHVGGNAYTNIVGKQLSYVGSDRSSNDTQSTAFAVTEPSSPYVSYTSIQGPAYFESGYTSEDDSSDVGYSQVCHANYDMTIHGHQNVTKKKDSWTTTHGDTKEIKYGDSWEFSFGNSLTTDIGHHFSTALGISLAINLAIEITSTFLSVGLHRIEMSRNWLKLESVLMKYSNAQFDLKKTDLDTAFAELSLKQAALHTIL